MPTTATAQLIVEAIMEDLTDRKGLRQTWEGIDESIQKEIQAAWRESISEILEGANGAEGRP